jgi:16S rRNA (guanine1516-N2)-methyltransferase
MKKRHKTELKSNQPLLPPQISILNSNLVPDHLQSIVDVYKLENKDSTLFDLVNQPRDWQLRDIDRAWRLVNDADSGFAPLVVDFVGGKAGHRRKFGGGKGQDIAKAVGLNKTATLHLADFTAGLGRDAFVFASLGCKVSLFERNPVVQFLLADGLHRASLDEETFEITQNMTLSCHDSLVYSPDNHSENTNEERFDVVYLDPMFPSRKKSALVKKEMRIFHDLVGQDLDADGLFANAWVQAKYRVVVKRPKDAPFLADKTPTLQFSGKTGRFDVYIKKGFEK